MSKKNKKIESKKTEIKKEKKEVKKFFNQKFTSFIVVTLVLALIAGSISYFGTGRANKASQTSPVYKTIYGHDITKGEYQVFYGLLVSDFIDSYAMYLDTWGLDVNKDFSLQQYNDNYTWEEVFIEQTEKQIANFVVLNDDIKKTKTKVDSKEETDALIDVFKQNAEGKEMEFMDYIHTIFGPDVTEADLNNALKYQYDAYKYSNILYDKFFEEPTDKDLITLYTMYPATFDKVTYRLFTINEEDKETVLNEITDENSFIEIAKNYTSNDTLFTDVGTQNLNDVEVIISWLYDETRKEGDFTVVNDGTTFYALYFKSRKLCEDKTVDFRHIFFNTYGADEAEKNELLTKANAVYKLMGEEADYSEDSFSSFALIYSHDTTTAMRGGLLEGIRDGSVDDELNDWLFDENRKYGDIDIIETSLGYHIVFYVGENEIYWKKTAREYLAKQNYDNYLQTLASGYEQYQKELEEMNQNQGQLEEVNQNQEQ